MFVNILSKVIWQIQELNSRWSQLCRRLWIFFCLHGFLNGQGVRLVENLYWQGRFAELSVCRTKCPCKAPCFLSDAGCRHIKIHLMKHKPFLAPVEIGLVTWATYTEILLCYPNAEKYLMGLQRFFGSRPFTFPAAAAVLFLCPFPLSASVWIHFLWDTPPQLRLVPLSKVRRDETLLLEKFLNKNSAHSVGS